MDPMLEVIGITLLIPFCALGMMKMTDIWRQVALVRQGYVKADFTRPNRRQIVVFVKPADKVNVIEGRTYPFNDHPDYLVQESGILGTIPKISVDSKSSQQVRLVNSDSGDVNPQLMTGAGKLAYVRGQNDASTDLKQIMTWLKVSCLCSGLAALAAIGPMISSIGGK